MKELFKKNWVFISGLLGAIAVTLQQFIGNTPISWKAIGLSVFMAILSYLANEWRNKGLTVTGIIGVLAYTYVTIQATGTFSWNQFILASLLALLAAVAPPPKPDSYEK